jgi:hypothetical protein
MTKTNTAFYSLKNVAIIFGIIVLYLLVSYFLIGFKSDQLVLSGVFCVSYFGSATSRKFILGLFDYMKAFPNYDYNEVNIAALHDTEQSLFGINENGVIITPNEFWLHHTTNWLDVMAGIFYLCWIPVPLAFAAWLFLKDKKIFLEFSFTFVLVNMMGFIIYYAYPAAPPWYFERYGAAFIAHTPGNSAGLHRFDDYFNAGIFSSIYAKSSNVFAAMPSLHSSYPLIVLYYGIKKKMGWINLLFIVVMAGIWFTAVYASHHYLLDVLAGIVCAITGIFIFQKGLMNTESFKKFLQYFLSKI